MTDRWTKEVERGAWSRGEPIVCAHCEHVYKTFNQIDIMSHCRQNHREFYKRMWDKEIVPNNPNAAKMYPDFVPLD